MTPPARREFTQAQDFHGAPGASRPTKQRANVFVREYICLLYNINPKIVRNADIIVKLTEYFERVRAYVPCYALRKELGLRISSNSGEKANDLIVSSRQKHNGMSWSNEGSIAFASVSAAAIRNGEIENWICHDKLKLRLSPHIAV